MTTTPFSHKIINGTILARQSLQQTATGVSFLVQEGWPRPRLFSITFGTGNEAIARYVRNQRRAAESCGVEFEERILSPLTTKTDLQEVIHRINIDPRATGVIIQRPVPSHLSVREIQEAVHPFKDVEGMNPTSIGHVVYGDDESAAATTTNNNQMLMGGILAPCTARAAIACLKSTSLGRRKNNSLQGLDAVVVGHSEIVGKPISFMLLHEGATVTTCHLNTKDLRSHTRMADAVFVAVGKPGLIRGDDLKPGAALIDIGINPSPDGKSIVGDADFESCASVAGWITPVPGGVGPVTTAILMENTLRAAMKQRQHYIDSFSTLMLF
jgi:methylenetetrahydrofolate dehydrogenase (NADP+)/methenyltetrahydrofolate cyclohydrolase